MGPLSVDWVYFRLFSFEPFDGTAALGQ
jgi:hypothetical protein